MPTGMGKRLIPGQAGSADRRYSSSAVKRIGWQVQASGLAVVRRR